MVANVLDWEISNVYEVAPVTAAQLKEGSNDTPAESFTGIVRVGGAAVPVPTRKDISLVFVMAPAIPVILTV